MTKDEVAEIIEIELVSLQVDALMTKFSNKSKLMNEVKYHGDALNKSLAMKISSFIKALQGFVNDNYFGYFEIQSFQHFTLDDFEYALKKNTEILLAMKRLIKFATK